MPKNQLTAAIADLLQQPRTSSKPPRALLDTDWKAWLKATDLSLWQDHRDPYSHNYVQRQGWSSECRALSGREWETIKRLIRQHGLVCSMRNACFGFGCGMDVFAGGEPIYPGIPITPEPLIHLTQKHLPGGKARFDDAWPHFVVFTHTDENAALLARNGLEAPLEKSHYEY